MSADDDVRRALWLDVLAFEAPIAMLEEQVAALGWSDGPEVATVRHVHIIQALQRYLDGGLAADGVARWAALIEARDELQFGDGSDDTILPDVLFELATPEINDVLTPGSATRLIARLSGPQEAAPEA